MTTVRMMSSVCAVIGVFALANGCSCSRAPRVIGNGDSGGFPTTDANGQIIDAWRPNQPQGDGTVEMACGDLMATVRDFHSTHPDFETYGGTEAFTGLVETMLGADRKPVYAHPGATEQTTGPTEFAQWYNDVAGVNETFEVGLPLVSAAAGSVVFDDATFFPIDGRGFGDEGSMGRDDQLHNFHFTTEIHTQFIYHGGETFTFTGDDDLWLFINNRLAIDLGGLHSELSDTVDLDDAAGELQITPGQMYPMDIFHAERHTIDSHFRIETTIECFILI